MKKNDKSGRLAFLTASRLAFPRLVGSPGESVARERVAEAFQKAGLSVEEEIFFCSDFAIQVAARWAMAPTGVMLMLAVLLLSGGRPALALALALASLLPAAYMSSRSQTGFHRRARTPRYRCANLIGRPPGETDPGLDVILMAHYDSKSQAFPIWLRIALFIAGAAAIIALVIMISACAIIALLGAPCLYQPVLIPATAACLLVSLSFTANSVGNLSDGALDNASGVGIITEIAALLSADPPVGIRLRAVATAGEEIGMCGANAFLEKHCAELDLKNTVILNFDGCGAGRSVSVLYAYGIPRKKAAPRLMRLIREIARARGLSLRETFIPLGMATDLMPFRKAGYEGVDFIGLAGKSHSTADRMDRVHEDALADYVTMGVELVRMLADGGPS